MVRVKNPLLRRYWIEFEPPPHEELPPGVIRLAPWPPAGCGVTAYTLEDALSLMNEYLGCVGPIPPIRAVIEDVDLSTIDLLRHVRRAVIVPIWRGIWYPLTTLSAELR